MAKKRIASIIIASVLLSWIFNIFPGRFLIAKISTWPLLNRLKILSPQAPIVITNRETVRVSDGGDVLQAASIIKSKISSVVQVKGSNVNVLGSAVNITSDGSFVTTASVFSAKTGNDFFVVTADGRQAQITQKVFDPATSLVFFKAALNNLPTASLGDSKDLKPGDKIIFVQNSLQNFSDKIAISWVNFSQSEIEAQILQSDFPKRAFGAESSEALTNGEPIINTNGEVVGIWNNGSIISSDVLKQSSALYFSNQQAITRPEFGFTYQQISQNDSKLTGQVQGAKIIDILQASAARQAGLLPGDIITSIDAQQVSESSQLEEMLQKYKPSEKVNFSILRKNQPVNINLTAGELK